MSVGCMGIKRMWVYDERNVFGFWFYLMIVVKFDFYSFEGWGYFCLFLILGMMGIGVLDLLEYGFYVFWDVMGIMF